ncbi:dephospho-CoA kinase [Granulicella arctica]|uniref:dephospho-CoA kinase n=1 Tax=Granulicella arctica TaxID=940613 RepID=UPI0021DFF251|nr:dephospho-CoA kinase [Granulicella arctica]
MLRVGLTGGLGSGKSTAAQMFGECGAVVLQSDAIGRELMQPGQAVYRAIVERFGSAFVMADGRLDRPALARAAFAEGGVEALNAIVHPAVIARQEELMRGLAANSVVVIESALLFETKYGGPSGWRERFDRLVLVTAPDSLKVVRFVERAGASAETKQAFEAEAQRRLALQITDEVKAPQCDFVLRNDGDLAALEAQVRQVWSELVKATIAGS